MKSSDLMDSKKGVYLLFWIFIILCVWLAVFFNVDKFIWKLFLLV